MLDLFGPTLHLHCSPHRLTLQQCSRFGRDIGPPIVRQIDDKAPSFDQFAQQLRSALSEFGRTGAVVPVVLPDAWCRLFVTTPPSNMASRADCNAAVAMRFQRLYGDSAADWVLRADWHVTKPFMAVALPLALHRDFLVVCQAFKHRIVVMVPESIAAFNQRCRAVIAGDWFARISARDLTLVVLDGAQLRHIVQHQLDAAAQCDADWLTHFMQREALRLNLSIPKRIICVGDVPPAWLTAALCAETETETETATETETNGDTEFLADVNRPTCFVVTAKPRRMSIPKNITAHAAAKKWFKPVASSERIK